MRKWIETVLTHPKTILVITVLLTIFLAAGLPRIHFDPSTKVLMPQNDPYFLMGERAKHIYGDNRTFLIAGIEPRDKSIPLFSTQLFNHMNELDLELNEYKDFNAELEDSRFQTILETSGVKAVGSGIVQEKNQDKQSKTLSEENPESNLDSEILGEESTNQERNSDENNLDEEILNENKSKQNTSEEENLDKEILEGEETSKNQQEKDSQENPEEAVWDLTKPFHEENYAEFRRKEREFNFDHYKLVSLNEIAQNLDSNAMRTIRTAARMANLADFNKKLTKGEFEDFMEAYQQIYLYKSAEIIKYLMTPISGEDIEGTKDELKPVDLLPTDENGHHILPKSKKDFEKLRKKLLKNPQFRSVLYGTNPDGSMRAFGFTIILRTLKRYKVIRNILWNVVMKYDHYPAKIYFLGSLVFNKIMTEFQQDDLRKFLPLVVLVIILTFYFNFRSGRGLVLPTITVVLGSVWTIGLMGWLGVKLTMIGTILPPLLIAVGSSYSIHIFNQYMQELHNLHTGDKKQILLESMTHISTTVWLAGFTTFISFLTLLLNDVTGLQSFGLFAAIGTVLAVVLAVSLIPAALMILKVLPLRKQAESDAPKTHNQFIFSIILFLSKLSVKHSKFVIAIAVIALAIFGYGVTLVKTETSPVQFFKKDTYIRKASSYIGKVFDGSYVLTVILDSKQENGVYDPAFLKYADRLRQFIAQKEQEENYNMLHTSGFTDFIKRMHMAMNGDDPKYYKIPDDRSTIQDYLEIFSDEDEDSDGRIDVFERTVDREFRRIAIAVRLGERNGRDIGTEVSRRAMNRIQWFLDNQPNPNGYSYMIVGEPVNFVRLGQYIVRGQIKSILMSMVIVALVIFLLFRNERAGLTAIIPIGLAITLVFGAMGYFNIPLDIAQAILSSIAIGIGVDDTIHFLNTIRRNLKKGLDLDSAIAKTHEEAGLAIVYTSVALIFGFSILMLSNFKPIFYFGFLVSSVMAATTIGALLGLPAVIHFFKIDVSKERKGKIFDKLNLQRFLE
ncbi:MAG: hypothetical protein D6767_10710 [Candidatus Hydrogenedentota bacterium]|nr:MAG: hypothetical protein D6767_10710 [Candidatus Hydrogenedentota bacterium]